MQDSAQHNRKMAFAVLVITGKIITYINSSTQSRHRKSRPTRDVIGEDLFLLGSLIYPGRLEAERFKPGEEEHFTIGVHVTNWTRTRQFSLPNRGLTTRESSTGALAGVIEWWGHILANKSSRLIGVGLPENLRDVKLTREILSFLSVNDGTNNFH
ncbi:hypothetical protein RRG08_060392 [Elysia crispata]|uniref:Uncharacterized protein n=1 Tax=Elysia crispata TaxID=231223 RepID=A0AAE0ZHP4_9GAST|nr:hypothetical protein RRG08_060392 [Elysia crispata]